MLGWLKAIVRHLWESPADAIALLAAMAGVGAAWYTRIQARASKKQAELGEEQLRVQADALRSEEERTTKALDIAERSTKAAELSAQATQSLAEIGQRAWVTVSKIIVNQGQANVPDEHGRATPCHLLQVTAVLRNGGMSPALGFVAHTWLELREGPPAEIEPAVGDDASTGVLGPGETYELPTLLKTVKDSELWQERESHNLLLFGLCRYKDIFDHIRHTRWCHRFCVESGQFEPWISQLNTMD
jgi:type II secretory pathway pseudopilin PulG